MQAADLRNGDDLSQFRRLHGPGMRGVLAQRQMPSRLVIVIEIRTQIPTQRCFAKDDQMIEALTANRPDDAFHIGTLLGDRGAESTSSISRSLTWRVKSSPKIPSRSRSK